MRKIGIFGGTFNPIHNGHLNLVKSFCEKLNFDEVLLVPTNIPPHKENPTATNSIHRLNMCKLAVEGLEKVSVSDIEFQRDEKSYTYVTVSLLKEKYPDSEFYLIMGSDMFLSLEKWYCYEKLKDMVAFCVASREESQHEKLLSHAKTLEVNGAKTIVIRNDVLEISSTEIREKAMFLEDFSDLVPPKVLEYIKENNLYALKEQTEIYKKILEQRLTEKRYYHSLCVAESAVYLANKYGANPNKAYFAGLLHDITKQEDEKTQLKILSSSAIICDDVEKVNKPLWHAITGAWYVENILRVNDREVIDAIRWHTEFRENATLLDKIIYLADFISADRDYEDVDIMREKCEQSLEDGILYGLSYTIKDNAINGKPIGVESIKAYNSILLKNKEKKNDL